MKDFIKNAAKHTGIFSLGDILRRMIGLILLPIYLRFLTPQDYGLLELLNILLLFCGMIILQGIPTAAFRGINFDYKDSSSDQKEVVGTGYLYLLFSSLAFYGTLFLFSDFISRILFSSESHGRLIKVVLITGFCGSVNNIPFVVYRARLKSVQAVTLSIANFILNATLNIYFIVYLKKGVEGLILGNCITALALFITTPFLIWNELKLRISYPKLKEMLSYGWPLIPGAICAWILSSADRYLLEHLSARSELGLYALAFKIAVIIKFVFMDPFQKTWPALFFPVAREKDAATVLGRFATYFLFMSAMLGLGLILFSQPLIMVVGPPVYWPAHEAVCFLVVAFILDGLQQLLNVSIYVDRKTHFAPIIVLSGAILNVLLNLIFIPKHGMLGASVATAASSFAMVTIAYFVNQKFFTVEYEMRRICLLSFIFITIIVIDRCLTHFVILPYISNWLSLERAILLSCFKLVVWSSFPVTLMLTGFLDLNEIAEFQSFIERVPKFGAYLSLMLFRLTRIRGGNR